MRRARLKRLLARMASCITVLAAAGPAAGAGPEVRIEWVKEYGSDGAWLELEAAAWRKPDLLLAVKTHVPQTDANRHSLIRVDSDGRELGRTEVPPSYVLVSALAAGATDRVFATADAPVDHAWLLRLDAALGLRAQQRLGGANELTVLRLVSTPAERFVIAGHASSHGVAIVVDAGGDQPWPEKRIEPKVNLVRDAVSSEDGGLVLLGNNTDAEGTAGPTSVWIGRLDSSGGIVKERTLQGRHGRIVRAAPPGVYAVLYDESTDRAQKIRLRVLNADLQDVSTTSVLDVGEGFQEFELGRWGNGYLVAGGKDDRPWFVTVSAAGKLGTPTWAETMSPSEKYELVAADEGGFVASSVFVEFTDSAGKRQAEQKVRIIKLGRDAA